jgi:hypothetical protein
MRIFALFQKRFEGDDALLELARVKFARLNLGAEFYAENFDEMGRLLRFRPSRENRSAVHMNRVIDLLKEGDRRFLFEFARKFSDSLFGLIVHDQKEARKGFDDYLAVLDAIDSALKTIDSGPLLYIEYAVGLDPDLFIKIFENSREFDRIGVCIDTGHLGLWQVKKTYSEKHPKENLFALTPSTPGLIDLILDVQEAVRSALPTTIKVIRAIGEMGKPLHFHLHDGHPLSTFSPYGVSDHLSFLTSIPLPFEVEGKNFLSCMYGPEGLEKIVRESLTRPGREKVSFSLEIHPTEGRLPLGEDAHLFSHWKEMENAERMNYWLSVLEKNRDLVLKACRE